MMLMERKKKRGGGCTVKEEEGWRETFVVGVCCRSRCSSICIDLQTDVRVQAS